MEQKFWAERWANQQTAFHLSTPNPRLVPHVAELGPPGRVLVPLCGKSIDLRFLAAAGFAVEGIEFVESAAQAFFAEAGVTPSVETQTGFTAYRHESIRIWVADILALREGVFPPVDAIYDRAALVALEPTTRTAYVEHLHRLSREGARLLLISFEHDSPSGPPFSVEADVVQQLFTGSFDVSLVERVDVSSESPRMQERGITRIHEAVWAGTRR